MSDQQPQPTNGEAIATTPVAPVASEPVKAAADAEPVLLAPNQEETSPGPDAPKVDAPRVEAVAAEAPKVVAGETEAPNVEAAKVEAPKIDAVKPEAPRFSENVMIVSPGDRTGPEPKAAPQAPPAKRRFGAMAAMVALATVAGALGGALATAGIGKLIAEEPAAPQASVKDSALEATVARLDADITALKASLDQTAKAGTTQFNKANDRLDKVEKAQAEPAAKLARLSEAVDKLRTAQVSAPSAPALAAAPAAVASRDVTGPIPQQQVAAAGPATVPAAPPKPEVARLPTVEGWRLRDVANGSALIESRRGMYEVFAGDPVPGLGRVDAIRKQDGRWVVVTSKGLIVSR